MTPRGTHTLCRRVSYVRIGKHLRKHICSLRHRHWHSRQATTTLTISNSLDESLADYWHGRRVFGRQMQHIRVRSYLSPPLIPGPAPPSFPAFRTSLVREARNFESVRYACGAGLSTALYQDFRGENASLYLNDTCTSRQHPLASHSSSH